MKQLPKVSVCMITYNHEQYIEKSIEGVLTQKCNFNFELIVANDKSSDKTDEVIKNILITHPLLNRIKYFSHKKNLGMMANFIFTLEKCQGKYIAICDGDDHWTDPYKLQKQYDFLEENKSYSLCATKTQRINEQGEKGENTGKIYGKITLDDVLRQNQFGTCTVVLRSEFLKIPYFDNLMSFFGADWPLWCFMLSKGPGYNMKDLTAIYHDHAGGASSGRSRINILRNKLEDRLLMIENFPDRKKIIKNYGLKVIFHYTWKSLRGQKSYYRALLENKKLVKSYLFY